MSSDSLSQSDIDALFQQGEAAAVVEPDHQADEVRRYDFRRPSRISKEKLGSLRAIYGLVTKGMEAWFAGRVRDVVSLSLETVEPLTFGEFTLALPSPCASYILSLGEGRDGSAVIEIGREFAFLVVDRFLGGVGEPEIPDRSLTLLERAVVRIVVDQIAHQLQEAWQDYVGLELGVAGFESIPEMLQVANPEDPVLVANVRVEVEGEASLVLICLPFPALERFFTGTHVRRLSVAQGSGEERAEERRWIEDHIRSAGLPVSARIPSFQVPLGVLSSLQEGAVLATGFPPDAELEVRVSGIPRYSAAGGRQGEHRAVSILDRIPVDGSVPNSGVFTVD
jgi:flagellar motor switch protein FliM